MLNIASKGKRMLCSRDFVGPFLAVPLLVCGVEGEATAQDVVITPRFEFAGNFHKGVAPVLLDKMWGLVDRTGAWVLQPRYAELGIGGAGLFPARVEGSWGFVNSSGHLAIPPRFEQVEAFDGGLAAVKLNGRWGYLRTDGSVETGFIFHEVGGREGQYVSARDDEGWAVFKIIRDGAPKRQDLHIYDSVEDVLVQRAYSIAEGSVIVKSSKGERLFLIDSGGPRGEDGFDAVLRFDTFVSIRRMSEGLAPGSTAPNKWGYLHKASGDFLWAGRFQDALEFSRGFAPVKIGGKWGYIDRTGRIAVEPTHDATFPFRGEYAVIRQGDKRGFLRLDPQGAISVFVKPQYEDAFRFTEGLAPIKTGGRWGYISDGKPWTELFDTGVVYIEPKEPK
jgi:hypothetical protein